jgi:hypothetical protein
LLDTPPPFTYTRARKKGSPIKPAYKEENGMKIGENMKTLCRVILCFFVLLVMGNVPPLVDKLAAAETPRLETGTEPPASVDALSAGKINDGYPA